MVQEILLKRLSKALAALMFGVSEPFMQILVEGIMGKIHLIILNLNQWLRKRCLRKSLRMTDNGRKQLTLS